MAWITPKTNWTTADGVDYTDLNRIEGDISFIATNPTGTALQLSPGGGNVLIGTSVDDGVSKLQVEGGVNSLGVEVRSPTIPAKTLSLSYSDSADVGRIEALHSGVAFKSIALVPSAGNILIGTTTDNGTDKLQVNGTGHFSFGRKITKAYGSGAGTSNDFFDAFSPFLTTGVEVFAHGIVQQSGLDFHVFSMKKISGTTIECISVVPGTQYVATLYLSDGLGTAMNGRIVI